MKPDNQHRQQWTEEYIEHGQQQEDKLMEKYKRLANRNYINSQVKDLEIEHQHQKKRMNKNKKQKHQQKHKKTRGKCSQESINVNKENISANIMLGSSSSSRR